MAVCRRRLLGKMSSHARDKAIVLCVVLVSVAVCGSATQQPETVNDTETELVKKTGTCSWSQSQSLFFSVYEDNGNISLEVLAPFCITPLSSLSLANQTLLQAECTGNETKRRWSRCNILDVRDDENGDRLFVLYPVREGVVIVHFDLRLSSVLNYTVVSTAGLPCQLTTLWMEDERSVVHAACLHINASVLPSRFKLYRLKIHAIWNDLNQTSYSEPVLIFGKNHSEILSNFITNVKVHDCSDFRNHLYFGWHVTLYRSNSVTLRTESHFHPFTSKCEYISEIERFDRVSMAVMCPKQVFETIDVCLGTIKSWSITQDGIPRSCSQSDETIVYEKETGFSVGSSDSLPVHVPTDNVTSTRCIQGNNTAWLIIDSNNSSVTVLRTDDGSIRMLTENNTVHGAPVGRVRVWGEHYIGFGNGTHFLVLDITCLRGTPLYVLPYIPSIDFMLPGDISEKCIGPVMPSSTIISSVAESVSSTAGSSISTIHTPVATVGTVSSNKKSERLWGLVGVGIPVVAAVAAAAAAVILIVFIIICRVQKKQRTTRVQGQSLLHEDPSTIETSLSTPDPTDSSSGASSSTPPSGHTGVANSLPSKADSTSSGSATDSPMPAPPVENSKPVGPTPVSMHPATPSSEASISGAKCSEIHSPTPSPKRKPSAMPPAPPLFEDSVITSPIEEEGRARHPYSPMQPLGHVYEDSHSQSPSPSPSLLFQNIEAEVECGQNRDTTSSVPVAGTPLPFPREQGGLQRLVSQQAPPEQQAPPPPPNHQLPQQPQLQHQHGAQGEDSSIDDMTGQGNKRQ